MKDYKLDDMALLLNHKATLTCAKAEAFVRWLNDEGLDSYWKDGKLLYYYRERDSENIPPEVVLARFEDEQKERIK
jgi:hypothetical protein